MVKVFRLYRSSFLIYARTFKVFTSNPAVDVALFLCLWHVIVHQNVDRVHELYLCLISIEKKARGKPQKIKIITQNEFYDFIVSHVNIVMSIELVEYLKS